MSADKRRRKAIERREAWADPQPTGLLGNDDLRDFLARSEPRHYRDVLPRIASRLVAEECSHVWLDRPESDTATCLVCGVDK